MPGCRRHDSDAINGRPESKTAGEAGTTPSKVCGPAGRETDGDSKDCPPTRIMEVNRGVDSSGF